MSAFFVTPFGQLELERWPPDQTGTLQAWDAADDYLLSYVRELVDDGRLKTVSANADAPRILLINDGFGALSCALHEYRLINWSDSLIAHRCADWNRTRNGIDSALECVTSLEVPSGPFDLVLIRVPKTLGLLQDQLRRLRPCLAEGTRIIAGGMIKHLPRSAFGIIEQELGAVSTSLARRKARLIFAKIDVETSGVDSPAPRTFFDERTGLSFRNHANVFSRDRVDAGARFLLAHFGQLPASERAIDLGCGSGVLGIDLQRRQPGCAVRYTDESYMAVASARDNHALAFGTWATVPKAAFEPRIALCGVEAQSHDLIVCNPPFHQQYVVGTRASMAMLEAGKRVLTRHGELWIVANRHLRYQKSLDALFGNCRTVATNKQFVVLRVIKR